MSVGIPGQNLLNMALTVIAKQTITYYRFASRALNDIGQDVTTYQDPIFIVGSFQPVPRTLYEQYGLDLQKDYFTFYTSTDNYDVRRNVSGDQIAFNGDRYQCESNNEWFALDGWNGILCVKIGEDTPASESVVWGFNSPTDNSTNVNFGHGNFLPPKVKPTIWGFGTVPGSNTNLNFGHGNFLGTGT